MAPEHDSPPGGAGGASTQGMADRSSHLSFVAHEIRNPLSTALWTAELLARLPPEERGGARGEKLAGICLRSVGRVRLLVEDHLLCERLDAGGHPIRAERVLLGELLEAIRGRWPTGDGALTLPPEEGLAAMADRGLLERALEAILVAAGEGGVPVRVEAWLRDGQLQVRAVGAPPAPLVDPGRGAPSDQRGRALALPMARRVAAALGGALEIAGEGYLLSIPAA